MLTKLRRFRDEAERRFLPWVIRVMGHLVHRVNHPEDTARPYEGASLYPKTDFQKLLDGVNQQIKEIMEGKVSYRTPQHPLPSPLLGMPLPGSLVDCDKSPRETSVITNATRQSAQAAKASQLPGLLRWAAGMMEETGGGRHRKK